MQEDIREEDICTGTVHANRKGLPPSVNKKQIVKNALVALRINIRNVSSVLKIEQIYTKVHALEPGVVSVLLHSVL